MLIKYFEIFNSIFDIIKIYTIKTRVYLKPVHVICLKIFEILKLIFSHRNRFIYIECSTKYKTTHFWFMLLPCASLHNTVKYSKHTF